MLQIDGIVFVCFCLWYYSRKWKQFEFFLGDFSCCSMCKRLQMFKCLRWFLCWLELIAKGPIIWGYYYSSIVCARLRHRINKEKSAHISLRLTALESAVYALTHCCRKAERWDWNFIWESLALYFSTCGGKSYLTSVDVTFSPLGTGMKQLASDTLVSNE